MKIRFPDRLLRKVEYSLTNVFGTALYRQIIETIDDLHLVPYRTPSYRFTIEEGRSRTPGLLTEIWTFKEIWKQRRSCQEECHKIAVILWNLWKDPWPWKNNQQRNILGIFFRVPPKRWRSGRRWVYGYGKEAIWAGITINRLKWINADDVHLATLWVSFVNSYSCLRPPICWCFNVLHEFFFSIPVVDLWLLCFLRYAMVVNTCNRQYVFSSQPIVI